MADLREEKADSLRSPMLEITGGYTYGKALWTRRHDYMLVSLSLAVLSGDSMCMRMCCLSKVSLDETDRIW